MSPPRVLTIAGSDSGGGAGIQADLKTFLSLGTYGLSVLTALTAQNTTGVSAIHACPPDFIIKQLRSVTQDIRIDAIKIGMLCNQQIVQALAEELSAWVETPGGFGVPIVLDPVMVSTSGSLLLSEGAIMTLIEDLLPLCAILTPNLPEAKQLLKYAARLKEVATASANEWKVPEEIDTLAMMEAARKLAGLGPRSVLVKGGHAKLSRKEVESQIRSIQADAEEVIVMPFELRTPVTGVKFPARSLTKKHADSSMIRQRDARTLAGVEGASITRMGNVTIVRTDQQPFAEVLLAASCSQEGTSDSDPVICDVLYEQDEEMEQGHYTLFFKPYVRSTATHGTGCTLSSALAASLSQGQSLLRSTSIAIDYVQRAISRGIEDLGAGSGPLDHSFPIQPRGLLPATLQHPYPLCSSLVSNSLHIWKDFVRNPFVLGVADSSLPREDFVWYLKQDYLFLRHYARVWSQAAAYSCNSFADIALFAEVTATMVEEAELHVRLCGESFGISRGELERGVVESAATLAYTRYVMEVGKSEKILELLVALAPCMLGYGEVGLWLGKQRNAAGRDPDYESWIDGYAGSEFQDAVKKFIEIVEAKARVDPPSSLRLAELQKIWNAACRLEIGMWDEAVKPELRRSVLEP